MIWRFIYFSKISFQIRTTNIFRSDTVNPTLHYFYLIHGLVCTFMSERESRQLTRSRPRKKKTNPLTILKHDAFQDPPNCCTESTFDRGPGVERSLQIFGCFCTKLDHRWVNLVETQHVTPCSIPAVKQVQNMQQWCIQITLHC